MNNNIIKILEPYITRLRLPTHTKLKPREFVLENKGNNKYRVHLRVWDGEKVPGKISTQDKELLFNSLYNEIPYGAEILFPESRPGYYATRGTIAGLKRLERDSRFFPWEKGSLQYVDKDNVIKTYNGTSFIKLPQTPEQWTVAQDAAIARGNMAEAQRLRDLHFKIIDPKASNSVFSHATGYDTPDFNSFDLSRTGQNYPQSRRFGKNVAFFSEEFDPTGFGAQWPLWGRKYRLFKLGSTSSQRLQFPEAEVIVDNPNQIKLADAVTYDDSGIRIPLGLRDNFNINDIRYGLIPLLGISLATKLGISETKKGEQ